MATTVTLVTLTADAQPPRRSVQPSLRDERGCATELQRALRMGDRDAVAGLLRYPARVSVKQRPYPIFVKDRASLVEMYDLVFTPHLRCAIVESREPAEGAPTEIFIASRSRRRVSRRRSHHRRAVAREVPNHADDLVWRYVDAPGQTAPGHIRRGTTGSGTRVAEDGADAYVVVARAGARLQAAIRGFSAGSLSLRVSRRGSETFLDGAGRVGSTWAARLNEGGEYLVEVVRRAPYCEPPVIGHLLTLSLTDQ
jgi:hypothetical protein